MGRQRDGHLQGRVAGAHHQQVEVAKLLGVDQPGADVGKVVARGAQTARVALRADGEHDARGVVVLGGGLDVEAAARLLDAGHLPAEAHVQTHSGGEARPAVEDRLTRAGREGHLAAPWDQPRLGHHVFALLVAVDGVGEVVAALEHDVAQSPGRRLCGGRETGWAGPDDPHERLRCLPPP